MDELTRSGTEGLIPLWTFLDILWRPRTLGGMNVSLGKLGDWVKSQVEHGDFATDSEADWAALRHLAREGKPKGRK